MKFTDLTPERNKQLQRELQKHLEDFVKNTEFKDIKNIRFLVDSSSEEGKEHFCSYIFDYVTKKEEA